MRLFALATFALGLAGCTVQSTETPDLTGPSEFASSFRLTATPDSISQDGASQTSVVVSAFGADGKPKSGVTFRLEIRVGNQPADYGTLSGRTIVTGSDGRAIVSYTAPPAAPAGALLGTCAPAVGNPAAVGPCVTIAATPIDTNFGGVHTETVTIHLVPVGVIIVNAPTPQFTFAPASPTAATPVQFDASSSCAGPLTGTTCQATGTVITDYSWNFGDGTIVSGPNAITSHTFVTAQSYSVTLTVTNDRGASASVTKQLAMGAGVAPVSSFVFSPAAPAPLTQVQFNGELSTAGPGRTLVQYLWNFGDGDTGSGSVQDHDFVAAGAYTVVLTVIDDLGQRATSSKVVTVTIPTP